MLCTTLKEGIDCFFMKKSGCDYPGGNCLQTIEQCQGCQKISKYPSGKFCNSFPDPNAKWRIGICNMATHIERTPEVVEKLNPIKASKRGQ